jgi:TRAP-type C4-dicarboxylate transport system substrate-binding protein
VNQQVWQTFPEEDRKLLREAAIEAGQWEIEMSRSQKDERLAKIRERGVEVTELTEEQRQAFVDATQSVYETWTPQIGEELVETARTAVANR